MTSDFKIAIGAILFFIAWNVGARYFWMNYQHDKDLAAPADTMKVKLPIIRSPLPPDTSIVHRDTLGGRKPIAVKLGHFKGGGREAFDLSEADSTLIAELRARIAYLEEPVTVTFPDSNGGEEVIYDPVTENFTRIRTPILLIQPEESFITRSIPKVESPTSEFWTQVNLLYSGGAGVMATLGFKTLGVGYGIISEKPAYAVILHFTL